MSRPTSETPVTVQPTGPAREQRVSGGLRRSRDLHSTALARGDCLPGADGPPQWSLL